MNKKIVNKEFGTILSFVHPLAIFEHTHCSGDFLVHCFPAIQVFHVLKNTKMALPSTVRSFHTLFFLSVACSPWLPSLWKRLFIPLDVVPQGFLFYFHHPTVRSGLHVKSPGYIPACLSVIMLPVAIV